jgi:hypothetical protein
MCKYRKYDAANDKYYCCVGGDECNPDNCFKKRKVKE